MEPLDDIPAERVGHDHEEEHGLVPDDPLEEPFEVAGRAPLDVEQADHRPHEDQEIGHTEVGARPPHPLDQDGTGQYETTTRIGSATKMPKAKTRKATPGPAEAMPTEIPATAATTTTSTTRARSTGRHPPAPVGHAGGGPRDGDARLIGASGL